MYPVKFPLFSHIATYITEINVIFFFQYLAAPIKEKQQTLTYWKLEPREHRHICLQNK